VTKKSNKQQATSRIFDFETAASAAKITGFQYLFQVVCTCAAVPWSVQSLATCRRSNLLARAEPV
jgi:hypothetical protein